MSTREAFLQAILETPDDDTPRLVFSDWLEDHDDVPRAELIRAQCELARTSPRERRYQELCWIIESLLATHQAAWLAELPRLEGVAWADFERGFVSTVRVDEVARLYQHDRAIAAAAPVYRVEFGKFDESTTPRPADAVSWLKTLRLVGRGQPRSRATDSLLDGVEEIDLVSMSEYFDPTWLTEHPPLESLRRIRMQGSHTSGQAIASWVVQSPSVELTHLQLGTRFVDYDSGYFQDPTLGSDGTVELVSASNLRNLEVLNLNRQRIGNAGLRALADSSVLGRLRELDMRATQFEHLSPLENSVGEPLVRLDLSLNPLHEAGARVIASARRMARLERLDLDTCEINALALRALIQGSYWTKTLRYLDLSRNPLGQAGARALAEAEEPAGLHSLILADCDFNPESSRSLASIAWLRNLLVLDLSSNALDSEGLARLDFLMGGGVRRLLLRETGLDAAALTRLAPIWTQLQDLDLSGNPLGNEGLAALLNAGTANNLTQLNLTRANLSQKGFTQFFQESDCPRLRVLNLSGNPLTNATVKQLVRSPLMDTVQDLSLVGCRLTSADAIFLSESESLCRLTRLNLRENELGEAGLVALASSPQLQRVELCLSGNPWSYKEASRKALEKRLGRDWYYYEDEEEDAGEEDYYDDEDEDQD